MTTAQTLLDLQQMDLELARLDGDVKALLQLDQVKKLRSQLLTLKSAHTQAKAHVKDIEFEIEDFESEIKRTEEQVTLAQEDANRVTDYRKVQDLENELSMFAKRLDKLAFDQRAAETQLEKALDDEASLARKVGEAEEALKTTAQGVREEAARLNEKLEQAKRKREHIAQGLDAGMLERYGRALKRYRGLAVEKLESNVPSICRMTLNEAMLHDLARKGPITECPSCHRILIMDAEAGEA